MSTTSEESRWQQTPTGWLWWNGTAWVPAERVAAETVKVKRPMSGTRKTVLVVGGLLVLVIGAAVFGGKQPAAPSTPPAAATLDADTTIAACEVDVERQLKAGKADHYSGEAAAEVTASKWTASGTVYATNSFNAVVPSAYSCTVTMAANGDVHATATLTVS